MIWKYKAPQLTVDVKGIVHRSLRPHSYSTGLVWIFVWIWNFWFCSCNAVQTERFDNNVWSGGVMLPWSFLLKHHSNGVCCTTMIIPSPVSLAKKKKRAYRNLWRNEHINSSVLKTFLCWLNFTKHRDCYKVLTEIPSINVWKRIIHLYNDYTFYVVKEHSFKIHL